ncbi:MAG: hypothetical protein LJE69_04095 [Thiohalocapsa sp.]|jgi:hypothetical protein|uniref:hypothetical protein n=1 Tax=Thiohalocapsa sp. TaxID=2497641 RepID=UPI0025DF528F|nr:hypothetical protein [Thiohalocapsa sp.]MCG6940415.1 hypothetical protein [Thiohalocapsa sp.]
MNEQALPVEIELVTGVKVCRDCKWFWEPTPAYGPFACFEFKPGEQLKPRPAVPTSDHKGIAWAELRTAGAHVIEPSILHGCRKAPIMTIGINPNMTAFYASTQGASWCYPRFQRAADYAFYHRYRTVFQESFAPGALGAWHVPGTEVRARAAGKLVSIQRGDAHRWILLELAYDDGTEEQIELTWDGDQRYVITKDRGGEGRVDAGDVLAVKLAVPAGQDVAVELNRVAYYQRFQTVLDRVNARLGSHLELGEDVSQHDLVACPSPGWTDKYDIPTEWIYHQCVEKNRWLLHQLVQSRPALLVFSGQSALAMFLRTMARHVQPDGERLRTALKQRGTDIFHLMQDLKERPRHLVVNHGGVAFRARIIASPHFSYDDNFFDRRGDCEAPGGYCRIPAPIWTAFTETFPAEAEFLACARRIARRPGYSGETLVCLDERPVDGGQPEAFRSFNALALKLLELFCFSPIDIMAEVIEDEIAAGNLTLDPQTGHLARSAGPCRFCDNEYWRFADGCSYPSGGGDARGAEQERAAVQALAGS